MPNNKITKLFNFVYQYLLGYDFFISYSRADGSNYSLALAKLLSDKDFTCFVDQWGSEVNKELPKSLLRVLNNSKILILLSTAQSRMSVNVQQEVELFSKTGKIIIPISTSIDDKASLWGKSIEGLAITTVTENEVDKGLVGDFVLDRIVNSFSYRKQKVRIKTLASSLIWLIILIPVIFFFTYLTYTNQIKEKNKELVQLNQKLTGDSIRLNNSIKHMNFSNDSMKVLNRNIQASIDAKNKSLDSVSNSLKMTNETLETSDNDGKQLYVLASGIVKKIYTIYRSENEFYRSLRQDPDNITSENGVAIVNFEFDSSVLNTSSYPILDRVSSLARENPSLRLNVAGYASAFGLGISSDDLGIKSQYRWGQFDFIIKSSDYLMRLTLARANSIKTYLVNSGVNARKIYTKGYGETRPSNTLGYFNDRVEIYLNN